MSRIAVARSRPAMLMLSGCFMLSALVRVFDPTNALAVEDTAAGTAVGAVESVPDAVDESYAGLTELLNTLRERGAHLDAREAKTREREKVIEAASSALRDQMARLEEAEARLSELLRIADKAADKDVGKLVATFQNMDAKRSGPIFENMDVPFAAGLISRMNDVAAASILAVLTPDKAYAITVQIAGQNALVPRE